MFDLIANLTKAGSKFDCLKSETVLGLESFDTSLFHWITLAIFVLAVIHTLSANQFNRLARFLDQKRSARGLERNVFVQVIYFFSEVEVIFALWAIPLFFTIFASFGWRTAVEYINTRDYTEPLFVVVIMCLSSTRPIIALAEGLLQRFAKLLGGSLSAWWFSLLTVGPILGSLITETGAMALCALLLSRQFYEYKPSPTLAYATLGLLFANISVGGVLTDFASPAVLVLAHCWKWNILTMITAFGWKAVLGIFFSNTLYWIYFRKEFAHLNHRFLQTVVEPASFIPRWVTLSHVLVIIWIVYTSHYPAVFIGSFLFFLGFHQATRMHQYPIRLTRPLLIGLFLAGLVIHGGLQGWWVVDLLQKLSPLGVLGVSMILTAFNDNTAISYLSTLVPDWGEAFKYAIFSGVVAGGGLTVIANAPNPVGYALLGRHFEGGISSVKLFLAAAIPTIIFYLIFFLAGPFF